MLVLHPEAPPGFLKAVNTVFKKYVQLEKMKEPARSKRYQVEDLSVSLSPAPQSVCRCNGGEGGEGAEHPLFLKGWAGNEDTGLRLLGSVLDRKSVV